MEYSLELPDTLVEKFARLGFDDPLEGLQEAAKLLLGLGAEAWGTITAAAQDAQTTPAKYILQRLKEEPQTAPTEAAKTKPEAKAKTPRPSNADRDAQIWELARTGSTHANIAAQFNLSVIRVSQIVALQRARHLRLDAAQGA